MRRKREKRSCGEQRESAERRRVTRLGESGRDRIQRARGPIEHRDRRLTRIGVEAIGAQGVSRLQRDLYLRMHDMVGVEHGRKLDGPRPGKCRVALGRRNLFDKVTAGIDARSAHEALRIDAHRRILPRPRAVLGQMTSLAIGHAQDGALQGRVVLRGTFDKLQAPRVGDRIGRLGLRERI